MVATEAIVCEFIIAAIKVPEIGSSGGIEDVVFIVVHAVNISAPVIDKIRGVTGADENYVVVYVGFGAKT